MGKYKRLTDKERDPAPSSQGLGDGRGEVSEALYFVSAGIQVVAECLWSRSASLFIFTC